MHIVITGGAGFLGSRLARRLLAEGHLTGTDGERKAITRITLLDVVAATGFDHADPRINIVTGDIADAGVVQRVITPDTQSIFHLAAIVSGQAEAEFDLGMRINFDATRLILERARALRTRPRMVFTSSVAVFGGDLPALVPDHALLMPQSSYGTQKAMGEMLVTDYSRKGYIDGRVLRLPTISVRPGVPNKAASSFASSIVREPLNGLQAVCPVARSTRLWLMAPQTAIDNLIHGHEIDAAGFGASRAVSLNGLSVTVGEMVDALQRVAGSDVVQRIVWHADPAIERVVNSWPGAFSAERAKALGFTADLNYDDIVRAHMADMDAMPAIRQE